MSPPALSSSYLPNLEAGFCKDYECCGILLPTLHDLLRHYEEAHIEALTAEDHHPQQRLRTNQADQESVATVEVFTTTTTSASPSASDVDTPMDMDTPDAFDPLDTMDTFDEDTNPLCITDPSHHLYLLSHAQPKPFACPVVGCPKTYKNANGLKYHRARGHVDQELRLNGDGLTYSVIDPISNAPYPENVVASGAAGGAMGVEGRPFGCQVCGKRYKNMNGLKYHRAHSTH